MLDIQVLGPLQASLHGRHVDLGPARQRAVLARLVAAGGQVVSADRFIDDLWQGQPPPKALAALQVYVSNLRRALEPDRPPPDALRRAAEAGRGRLRRRGGHLHRGLPADGRARRRERRGAGDTGQVRGAAGPRQRARLAGRARLPVGARAQRRHGRAGGRQAGLAARVVPVARLLLAAVGGAARADRRRAGGRRGGRPLLPQPAAVGGGAGRDAQRVRHSRARRAAARRPGAPDGPGSGPALCAGGGGRGTGRLAPLGPGGP
ncbi:winged helix-turn-helix domain-containing protein [Nonomuraea sp. NPDC052116]|uniref:AfsR/SARP family transcriptional regulator n=1 Tax=Nonomuraea sp. NPDC052116 TaxID=3155665 RepID=UPI003427D59A